MFTIDRPRLSELFIYYPHLCQKEGDEHKKLLYFFPHNTSMNERLKSLGLCEAVMSFTRFFDSACQTLQTSSTRRYFHPLTNDIWAVMSVMLPPRAKPTQDHAYHIDGDCHVNDQVLSTVLSTACETFELFNGKISALLDTEGLDILKQRLDHFFSRYLRTMLFEHCDLLDCFNGIQFTATDPADFARVQGLVNRIRYAFRSIRHVSFFYDGRLVQSTLELSYARHLYHYLNSFLFVEQPDLTHTAAVVKTKHLGRFLVGPKTLSDTTESVQCPVLCSPGSNLPDCQLVTYQALRAVLCLVVRGINPIPMNFFVRFDAMVGPRLTILADKLACHQSSSLVGGSVFPLHFTEDSVFTSAVTLSALGGSSTPDDGPSLATEDFCEQDLSSVPRLGRSRFIYWNASTYAVMTTLHIYTGSGRRQINGAKPLLDLMVNLRNELLLRPSSWHEEITVRLDPCVWLVARRSNGREIYMLFMRKQESLIKLDVYVSRLYNSVFRGLLLLG
ncbi:hypothetical protein CRM22_008283 [Opisthorchis felineus]|uniref:CCZ1/INTU/HSP4 first Longin domain-containing protein n=1 Tax=Opisthorchis felineus TaxID=147828 RepID=A0A4S2LCD4_OPIFE|nr:hypothetical protein CRM22_008283 [Opisthorchis felineus]TGZ60880.1 hypothetical protein CRM22_008283 [Opisthorchis felineus]TGZ60881.1 hypothetical protein CRM22_008283 [Opisthorchis felineus]TGZ60882.1 hypothetical protein CRM22_008283 [Opisthorchis felineus]